MYSQGQQIQPTQGARASIAMRFSPGRHSRGATRALSLLTILHAVHAFTLSELKLKWASKSTIERDQYQWNKRVAKELDASYHRRETMFPGWGDCNYGNMGTTPERKVRRVTTRHSRNGNLVVINALGKSLARLYNTERNIARHFRSNWECVAMVWASRADVPDSDLLCLRRFCEVERRSAEWGEFLVSINPTLVNHYKHVALLLDDVFIPDGYDVSQDLHVMDLHNLDVMQPAIFGAHHENSGPQKKECLYSNPPGTFYLEFFFTLFKAAAWSCLYNSMVQTGGGNPSGCGFDVCLPVVCPNLKMGVEARSAVYHIERALPPPSSGWGSSMNPYIGDFMKGQNCEWRIRAANCTAGHVYKELNMNFVTELDCSPRGAHTLHNTSQIDGR